MSSTVRSHRRSVLGRAVVAVGLSAGLLTAGWEAGTVPTVAALVTGTDPGTAGGDAVLASSRTASSGTTATSATATATAAATATPASSGATTTASAAAQTYTGEAVATRYGTVQVQATVEDGRLTAVDVLQWTDYGRYVQRVQQVLPDEVLSAGSADVQTVSGATYTSQGYLTSLQSALDQANA